ncbi:MAG: 2-oxo acid dehydrogenase subunit E2 [Candidatus Dormibacteraeota bacterium]|nr:2-oxo acid dehydrogenase subunit E2 [Candidatus Dormibacteraeota bacterium]MBV9526417.1 2-oxo acid dehydrogenase subunit E2 [Candidatus Dormibacteraeota bacterium]
MADVRDFLMPDLGEGLTEGEILNWLVAVGDEVAVDQPIAEIGTEKAVVQVPTPFAGRVAALHGTAGDMITVGRPLISIEVGSSEAAQAGSGNVLVGYGTNESASPPRRRRVTPAPGAPVAAVSAATPPASPLVRRMAAELGVDLAAVTGTGPGGMVTRADLEQARAHQAAPDTNGAAATAAGEVRKLTGADRVAAERLTGSHRDIPTAIAWAAADATRLIELRERVQADGGAEHVTPFAVLLRLCVLALGRFPRLNAHFDASRMEATSFEAVHLGVAVQTERGLVVPVIRDAEKLPVRGIARELSRLAGAARDGSIHGADLRGSTFTVSNFGAFGVDGGTAIINPPEAAVLGVGQIALRAWAVDGAVVARPVVELSLVFDHRVADGAVAGGFVRHLANLVEQPPEDAAGD